MQNIENFDKPHLSNGESKSGGGEFKTTIADKLQSAADSLRARVERSVNRQDLADQYGARTADWLEKTADYLRDFEPDKFKSDIESNVRKNPGRSLLIAGAVGLVLGAIVRRR